LYASSLDFQGLYTFPNPLAKVPVGACLIADNLTANKDGVAESRRGLAAVGSTFAGYTQWGGIKALFPYQNNLIAWGYNDATGSTQFLYGSGSFSWGYLGFGDAAPSGGGTSGPIGATRIRGVEANKNFYFTGSGGIHKLSAYNQTYTGTVKDYAGVPPGLDGSGVLDVSGAGFLAPATQCAYQIVFGYTDANGNLNLGAPSQRILVVNATGTAQNVVLTFSVPTFFAVALDTSCFYQIYRTPQTTYSATPSSNVPPGAEPQFSAQYNLTGGQISALSVTVTDVTTDALLDAALYTNPSQQGALQSNTVPPLCGDLCTYSQMMFYANCISVYSLPITLISVGGPNGIQVNDTITINGITFTAKATQVNASQQFAIYTSGTVAQNIDQTARNLVQCINANVTTVQNWAFYVSGYNQLPGQILIQNIGSSDASSRHLPAAELSTLLSLFLELRTSARMTCCQTVFLFQK
jgi:hypothetical protein